MVELAGYRNPKKDFREYKDVKGLEFQALFCKVLIYQGALGYKIIKERNDLIEILIKNCFGYEFKVTGSNWKFICIMVGKHMASKFNTRSKEDAKKRLKSLRTDLKKQVCFLSV